MKKLIATYIEYVDIEDVSDLQCEIRDILDNLNYPFIVDRDLIHLDEGKDAEAKMFRFHEFTFSVTNFEPCSGMVEIKVWEDV